MKRKQMSRRDFLKFASLLTGYTFAKSYNLVGSRNIDRLTQIERQGAATKVPAFEFHGDNYSFYNGSYSMTPETFIDLMTWFQKNEVWSATLNELEDFLSGNIQLPARSVILTTDSGNTSMSSLARIVPVLQRTSMHMNSFIWTKNMNASESSLCKPDNCWHAFRIAQKSGVFSFGTHTETHRDFAKLSEDEGVADILKSSRKITTMLGVVPKFISWPYESVPIWAEKLNTHGFKGAFAGNSRLSINLAYVQPKDDLVWSLPRIFPPSPGNLVSGRPNGKTIQEIMQNYSGGF